MSLVATGLTFRELPGEEWPKVRDIEPFDQAGLPPDNGHWRILVAELDGQIIGCTSVHTQVHWDPWWIAPEHRTNPVVVRGLVRQGAELLTNLGIDHAFCTISDEQFLSQRLATRLGFIEAPGKLYLLNIDQLKEF
jgi:hypothetical protein